MAGVKKRVKRIPHLGNGKRLAVDSDLLSKALQSEGFFSRVLVDSCSRPFFLFHETIPQKSALHINY